MLKVSDWEIFNLEGAIRGMRNPLESWGKIDSNFEEDTLGENDRELALKLCAAGSDHRKFMRQILVSLDIAAPLYWWKQFSTYSVGVVENSTSTMHNLHKEEITLEDFSIDFLSGYKKKVENIPNEIDEEKEVWKDYPENNLYFVSNQGRVIRKEYKSPSGRLNKERLLKNIKQLDGYARIGIQREGKNRYTTYPLHRIVAETFIPNPNNKKFVNHKDGNKLNNQVENLEWVTDVENAQHAIKENLIKYSYKRNQKISEKNSKLTKSEIKEIKLRRRKGETMEDISEDFDVTHQNIKDIVNGELHNIDITSFRIFEATVNKLEDLRLKYKETSDKRYWYEMVQLLPSSYTQKRTITLNYEVLSNIYSSRRNHKLKEWHQFARWIEELPHSDLILTAAGVDIDNA